MSKKEKSRLDQAWGAILQRSGADNPSRAKYLVAHDKSVGHGRTHFTRHDTFWTLFLGAIAGSEFAHEHLDILITASSVGAEVYDAARIAKTLGLENIHFYGHDKSAKFIERAKEGIFPKSAALQVPDSARWFSFNDPCQGYASIRRDQFDNVEFLEPSDIRNLSGEFDIAVANIMNPCPPDIADLLSAKAEHLALASYEVVKASDLFQGIAQNYNQALDDYVKRFSKPLQAKNPDTDAPGF